MDLGTYNEEVEIYLFWVIEINVFVDCLDLAEHFLFIFFLDKGACPASAFAEVAADGLIEVHNTDYRRADVRFLQFTLNFCRYCDHSTRGATTYT